MPNETTFQEQSVEQRPAEKIAYRFDTSPYGGSPTGIAITIADVTATTAGAGTDVTATKLEGASDLDGDVVTTPAVVGIEGGKRYRLQCLFVCGGNTYAPTIIIHGKY